MKHKILNFLNINNPAWHKKCFKYLKVETEILSLANAKIKYHSPRRTAMKISTNIAAFMLVGAGLILSPAVNAASCVNLQTEAQLANTSTDNFTVSTQCVMTTRGNGGNVNINQMNKKSAFGATNWKEIAKIDVPETLTSSTLTSSVFSITVNSDKKSGTWMLDKNYTFDPTHQYAFAIKGGNGDVPNLVYLMQTGSNTGTWKTDGLFNGGENVPGLSNIRLLGTGELKTVPLPAAAYLFGSALLGMAGIGYRRKSKAS